MNNEIEKRVQAVFYSTEAGAEPVRGALLELGKPTTTVVGEDICFIEFNWRVDRPYVDRLRSGRGEFEKGLYEARHTVRDIEYRTVFFVYGAEMVLVHFFQKTSQKTPRSDIDLAWSRMKRWVRNQKERELTFRKGARSHAKKT